MDTKDLYFFLKGLSINIPTLKDRKQDIPELFIYFLKKLIGPLPTLAPINR